MNLTKPEDHQLPQSTRLMLQKIDPLLAKHGLDNHVAKVAILMDFSVSMTSMYLSGQVQKLVEKFVALAHHFDDDGVIDIFAYHNNGKYIGGLNAVDFASTNIESFIKAKLGGYGGTNYASAFEAFMNYAASNAKPNDKTPWYVCFITDGQDGGSKRQVVELLQKMSHAPVFVQCIALGADYNPKGSSGWFGFGGNNNKVPEEFEFLAKLDSEVPNRFIDNCNFFAVKTPDSISDEDFFERMMNEYPTWLKEAKEKGLV